MLNETEYEVILKYNFISQQITKYAGISLYLLCLFGTTMNILTFMRQTYSSRPCSLYLLVASVFDLIFLNLGPLSHILQYGFHYDWTITSVAFCKTKSYINFVSGVISATLTTIAGIDRYILSSTDSTRWKYCTRPIAVRFIQFTIPFWFVVSTPIIYCFTRSGHPPHDEQFICSNRSRDPICVFIQILYICIFNGFLHPIIMVFFGVLTCTNIHHLRQRSLLKSARIQHINYQLTSMLILQLIKSSFSSFPFAIFNCYLLITQRMQKSSLYQTKENLVNQIFYILFWSNYTSFFVYMCSSDIFREQWIKSIKSIVFYFCKKRERRRSSQPETNRLTVS
jgi:hypothetical protein